MMFLIPIDIASSVSNLNIWAPILLNAPGKITTKTLNMWHKIQPGIKLPKSGFLTQSLILFSASLLFLFSLSSESFLTSFWALLSSVHNCKLCVYFENNNNNIEILILNFWTGFNLVYYQWLTFSAINNIPPAKNPNAGIYIPIET